MDKNSGDECIYGFKNYPEVKSVCGSPIEKEATDGEKLYGNIFYAPGNKLACSMPILGDGDGDGWMICDDYYCFVYMVLLILMISMMIQMILMIWKKKKMAQQAAAEAAAAALPGAARKAGRRAAKNEEGLEA